MTVVSVSAPKPLPVASVISMNLVCLLPEGAACSVKQKSMKSGQLQHFEWQIAGASDLAAKLKSWVMGVSLNKYKSSMEFGLDITSLKTFGLHVGCFNQMGCHGCSGLSQQTCHAPILPWSGPASFALFQAYKGCPSSDTHRNDLHFRRSGRIHGAHATHPRSAGTCRQSVCTTLQSSCRTTPRSGNG
eukprot:264972-Chlamydomonas_euryale.AAC.3